MTDYVEIMHLGVLSSKVLKDEFSQADVVFQEPEHPDDDRIGELATVTVIAALASPLVVALAAWILKTRRGDVVEFELKRVNADGSTEDIRFRHEIRNEEEPRAELISALSEALKIHV